MKRTLRGLITGLFLVMLVTVPVFAAYYATVQVVESDGNSYSMLAINATLDTDTLVDYHYITSSGLDTRVTTGAGTELPHMLADDKLLFASPISADSSYNYRFTTGNTPLDSFPVITGYGGYVTVTDHANLELGNNFTVAIDGWLVTPAPTNATYLYTKGTFEDNWVVGYSIGTGSQSKQSDHLYLYAYAASGGAQRTYVTDSAINLTGIDELWIEWENTGSVSSNNFAYLIASTSKTGDASIYNARLSKTSAFVRQWDSLDVSGLSGNHYIRVHAQETSSPAGIYSEVLTYRVTLAEPNLILNKEDAFYIHEVGGEIDACMVSGTVSRVVTATGISAVEHIGEVWADTTNFGIDIDGVTENTTALSGASVTDNANSWIISVPYFSCYNHTVGVNHRIRYEPDDIISGTTLPNELNPGTYDGVITWGSNPSGIAVSIGELISSSQPMPEPGIPTDITTPDIIQPTGVGDVQGGFGTLIDNPFYPLVKVLSDHWEVPVPIVGIWGALIIMLIVMGITFRYSPHQLITGIVGIGLAWLFYQMTIFPWWSLAIMGAVAIALIMYERKPSLG